MKLHKSQHEDRKWVSGCLLEGSVTERWRMGGEGRFRTANAAGHRLTANIKQKPTSPFNHTSTRLSMR